MTTLTLSRPERSTSVVDQLTRCVEELAILAGDGCLVETATGRLAAHQVLTADLGAPVVSAVMRGDFACLHRDLTHRRTTGLLPSGPVLEGDVDGQRLVYLALRDGDVSVGGAWLLPSDDRPLTLEDLRLPAQRLTGLLAVAAPDPEQPSLAACLDGAPLPADLASFERYWVVRVRADCPADALVRALPSSSTPTVRALRSGQQVYLLVAGPRRLSSERVRDVVQRLVAAAGARLEVAVSAGVSTAVESTALATARGQADASVTAAGPGTCVLLEQVRSQLVARHLSAALADLPDLGQDPLAVVLDYDAQRGGELAPALLAWFRTGGDVAKAATALSIHPNTLRYRMKRVQELLGLDLRDDPTTCLELHLRLIGREHP
jgi:hypothetical protein